MKTDETRKREENNYRLYKDYVISSISNYRFLLNLVWTLFVDNKHTRSDQSRELPYYPTKLCSAILFKKE